MITKATYACMLEYLHAHAIYEGQFQYGLLAFTFVVLSGNKSVLVMSLNAYNVLQNQNEEDVPMHLK